MFPVYSGSAAEGLKIETRSVGDFVVHCHRSRPQLVLANADEDGRIKIVSTAVIDVGNP